MKLCNLLLGLLLCAASASAQDVITKTDGSKVDARVEEITETVVKYRKASNPTGPIYNIPLTSVWTIVYENGSTDTFTAPANATPQIPAQQQPSVSDDELRRMAGNGYPTSQSGNMSDAQLLRLYKGSVTSQELRNKASRYKKIGWIGGGTILVAGIGVAILASRYEEGTGHGYVTNLDGNILAAVGGGSALAAAAWCVGFNVKANSLIKQAKAMEMYSMSIMEDEVLHFGNKSLIAGVNVMGDRFTKTHGLGLNFKFNF